MIGGSRPFAPERLEGDEAGEPFRRDREAEDREVHVEARDGPPEDHRIRRGLGMLELVDALVDREGAAAEEDQQGHQEGVEIDFAAVAERETGIRRLLRPLQPDEQQDLVGGVDHRVDALGQHGARAGEEGADELRHGDRQVGAGGGVDRAAALMSHVFKSSRRAASVAAADDGNAARRRMGPGMRDAMS